MCQNILHAIPILHIAFNFYISSDSKNIFFRAYAAKVYAKLKTQRKLLLNIKFFSDNKKDEQSHFNHEYRNIRRYQPDLPRRHAVLYRRTGCNAV